MHVYEGHKQASGMTAISMMHQLTDSWTLHVNIQTLALADKYTMVVQDQDSFSD